MGELHDVRCIELCTKYAKTPLLTLKRRILSLALFHSITPSTYPILMHDNATGEWTGDYELDISLGWAAFAVPDVSLTSTCSRNSSITLLDGGVRTEAFAVLSSEGCAPILIPDNPAQARAVLVAPQVRIYRLVQHGRTPTNQIATEADPFHRPSGTILGSRLATPRPYPSC